MAADGKKGITVKVDAALHAEITQYLQDHGMTMTEFVTLALQDELHPKIDEKEGKNMEKMRTLAFQVPESLFQRIKDYLHRNNMTQKDFVIGLIEQELDRDLAESQETGEAQGDFEDTEELEDTEQLDADQELPGDQETASSAEKMDEAEPSIPDQEVPGTSEEGPDAEELDEMSPSEETGEADYQDDEDMSEDALEDEGPARTLTRRRSTARTMAAVNMTTSPRGMRTRKKRRPSWRTNTKMNPGLRTKIWMRMNRKMKM